MRKPDVIFAQALGSPRTLPSNVKIADTALFWSRAYNLPIFTQRDVPIPNQPWVVFLDTENEPPPSGLTLIKRFVPWAKQNGYKRILLVAASLHTKRCARDLRKFGFKVWTVDYGNLPDSFWFRKESDQLWTRYQSLFQIREFIMLAAPWPVYNMVTGNSSSKLV